MQNVPHSEPETVQANGITLCYDTFGDPTHPPLLLIMGLGAQMIAWDEDFCAQLAGRGYWVVRFDNRDIGLSTRLTQLGVPDVKALIASLMMGRAVDVPYRLRDMAADTVGLMDALGIAKAHVVGASMGGAIAQEMAIHHAGRMATLTSIMSSTGDPGVPPPTPEAMEILFSPTPADWDGFLARYLKTWRVLRAGDFPLDEVRDRERAERIFARGLNPAGVARQLGAVLTSGSRKDALRSVRARTLVIHGDADPLVRVEGGIGTAEAVPGAKLVIIPRMGHAFPISMQPQIIDAIAQHAR